jgi:hypothetical protein
MKAPADGWDREEREAVEELRDELETLQVRRRDDPEIDLLRAARHDALPPDLQTVAHDRLVNDPWSRALVDGLDAAEPSLNETDQSRLLARIRRDARREETAASPWTWLRPLLASAALVAVAVTGWIAFRSPSQTPPAASTPRKETTIAATPKPPVLQLPLDKPDVTVSLAALTWRGATAENQLLADLKSPLDAFRADDYARAEREFAALEQKYPNAIEVLFYGGVSRLFLNDAQRAATALTRASELADATFAPRTAWYLAIAEQRTGKLAEARARFDDLCRGTNDRAPQACAAVKQIDATSATPRPR